jgi:mRNA interferase MazF
MAKILRGDIIWADLNPTQGHEQNRKRPVLILSHDVFKGILKNSIKISLLK